MEKTNMFIVIKVEDASKYLTPDEICNLSGMLDKISDGRKKNGKTPENTYYVCNTDEPYADAVHKVIIGGEALKSDESSYCNNPCGISNNHRILKE